MGLKAFKFFVKRHRAIALDTMVFVYHFESNAKYTDLTMHLFDAIEKGRHSGITSILTLLECTVKSFKADGAEELIDYISLLTTYPNLRLVDVNRDIALRAAELRAKYNIKTPDAIQVASGIVGGATGFVTNDKKLKAVKEINVFVLG